MSLRELLLRNHAKLAVPAFLGGTLMGVFYTLETGRSPYADLRAWAKGQSSDEEQPLRAVTLKLR